VRFNGEFGGGPVNDQRVSMDHMDQMYTAKFTIKPHFLSKFDVFYFFHQFDGQYDQTVPKLKVQINILMKIHHILT
jgi:hypothetical protein